MVDAHLLPQNCFSISDASLLSVPTGISPHLSTAQTIVLTHHTPANASQWAPTVSSTNFRPVDTRAARCKKHINQLHSDHGKLIPTPYRNVLLRAAQPRQNTWTAEGQWQDPLGTDYYSKNNKMASKHGSPLFTTWADVTEPGNLLWVMLMNGTTTSLGKGRGKKSLVHHMSLKLSAAHYHEERGQHQQSAALPCSTSFFPVLCVVLSHITHLIKLPFTHL